MSKSCSVFLSVFVFETYLQRETYNLYFLFSDEDFVPDKLSPSGDSGPDDQTGVAASLGENIDFIMHLCEPKVAVIEMNVES